MKKVYEIKLDIYPCSVFITKETDISKLSTKFFFCRRDNVLVETPLTIEEIQRDVVDGVDAACIPVIDRKTNRVGILLVRVTDFDVSVLVHECVHIADYIFDYTGMNAESFAEGNEAYAYLLGYLFGKIQKIIINGE